MKGKEIKMASAAASKRLRTEFRNLTKNPLENMRACPKETNILEWHYCIIGAKNSPYEGGFYHGIVKFPTDYPFKPPAIQMLTPNGRFKTQTRLCLSMSDFHPETWNPLWSVSTILMGLYSFMMEETPTQGSVITSAGYKRKLAKESLAYNIQDPIFCELFPELVQLHHELLLKKEHEPPSEEKSTDLYTVDNELDMTSWAKLAGLVGILGILLYLMMQLATL